MTDLGRRLRARPPRGRTRRTGAPTRSRWRRSAPRRPGAGAGARCGPWRRWRRACSPRRCCSRRREPTSLVDLRCRDIHEARARPRRDAAGRRAPAHGRARRALRAHVPWPAADLRRCRRGRLVAARVVRSGDARDRAHRREPARRAALVAASARADPPSALGAERLPVAYLSGGGIHLVDGDGSNDARLGAADGAAPAWRRARGRSQLAYAHGSTVILRDTIDRRVLFATRVAHRRSRSRGPPTPSACSSSSATASRSSTSSERCCALRAPRAARRTSPGPSLPAAGTGRSCGSRAPRAG